MGQYTPTQHPELLADHAVGYRQKDFIADEAVPITGTDSKLVKYFSFSRADSHRLSSTKMAPDGMPNQRKFTASSAEVSVDPWGLFDRIPFSDISSQSDGNELEQDTIEDLAEGLLLDREKRVSELLMTAASYAAGNKVTLATPWTNETSSTPIQTVQAGIRACALPPNMMIMDKVTWDAFRVHPDILDRLGGPSRGHGMASQEIVAEIFGLEKVLVGQTRYNSANDGATEVYDYIWPQGQVLIARQVAKPRRKENTLARTYRLNQAGNGGADAESGGGFLVTQETEATRGTAGTLFIKLAMEEKSLLISPDVGYHITGAS